MKVKPMLQCHLLVPDLSMHGVEAPRLPALESLLAFADQDVGVSESVESWLCQCFGVVRQYDWPVAPYAALGDGLTPGGQYWLCVDPVHLQLLRDRIIVQQCPEAEIGADEAALLVQTLNQHFSADGLQFFAPHASRWYLSLQHAPALQTHPLRDVLGLDANSLLSEGQDALMWHGRLNEVQMLLHDHPVNLEREEQGKQPVNSIWPWGGGGVRKSLNSPFDAVWAQPPFMRGLALAAGVASSSLPDSLTEWLNAIPGNGAHLVALDGLSASAASGDADAWRAALLQMEASWFVPLLDAVKAGRMATVHLHIAGAGQLRQFTISRDCLWKFWRRRKPLKAFLHD